MLSVVIMVLSTVVFFLGTTPAMILVSRAIQGASTTFTWVTGLAYLVAQVGEGELGGYVGWTTVGVAVGEIIGPMVGGPIYDYFGHWAAFGVVEAILLVDILLRLLAKEKGPEGDAETREDEDTEAGTDQDSETATLLEDEQGDSIDYEGISHRDRGTNSHRAVAGRLARDWLGTVFTLIVIFMVRGALEVVSERAYILLSVSSLTLVGGTFVSDTAVLLDSDQDQLSIVDHNPTGSGKPSGWKAHLTPGTKMVEHGCIRHLRHRINQFRERGRSFRGKQILLRSSLGCGRYRSGGLSKFQPSRHLGRFSTVWVCEDSCHKQGRGVGANTVLAQPKHDVERSDYVVGCGHSAWPSI